MHFITIAAQKSHLTLHHMEVYARTDLLDCFQNVTVALQAQARLGKSCIRIKKYEDMPLGLLGELCSRMAPQNRISCYEQAFRSGKRDG